MSLIRQINKKNIFGCPRQRRRCLLLLFVRLCVEDERENIRILVRRTTTFSTNCGTQG